MLKKLEEPFISYWTSKHPLKPEKLAKITGSEHHENEQYLALKEAIQLSLSQKVSY